MIVENFECILIVNIKFKKYFMVIFKWNFGVFCCCLFGYGGDINV